MDGLITIDCGEGTRVRAAAGTSVLQACTDEGIQLARACGGKGRCTTCRVLVEEGLGGCPSPNEIELEALGANGLKPPVRLACQLHPSGDIRIRILIPVHNAPSHEPPDAAEEHIAVIFADIRGFTAFAESRLPFDVCTVLNRYFDTMGIHIEQYEGRVLSYLGDGIVAAFRPGMGEAPEIRAVDCALAMRRSSRLFGQYTRDHYHADLQVGVAIHAGRAIIGQLGYFRQLQFNAVGDVLNVTSRIEEMNKELGTDLLVSESILEAYGGRLRIGKSIEMPIRGRTKSITVHQVVGRAKRT